MRFSQRIGTKPIRTEIQIGSMDDDLRIALWNAFHLFFLEKVQSRRISNSAFRAFFRALW
ncbi:MAG: hypothetical protein HQ523_07415, partial [Lentisphaerae bacterium]|nr:hypothetical protein [Lentisphaerota bacterium]